MKRTHLILAIVVAIFISCSNTGNKYNEKEIQIKLDELRVENGLPGLNCSIILPDGLQLDFSSGYADTITKEKLNTNHVLFSGSVGKTYAVAVLMQLVEKGKVDLDSKLLSYFPEPDWLVQLPGIDDITVRMLLEHTSGLPRYIESQAVWDSLQANPDKVWTYHDRLLYLIDKESVHEPGKGWSYSDSNYLLIGMLIEKITGNNYYDEVTKRILLPLNLEQTHPSLKRDMPNLPVGYSKLDDFFRMPGIVIKEGKYIVNPQMEWTGGGFASTTSDLARWAKSYYEARVFSKNLIKEIVTPNSNGMNVVENMDYGMGSFIYHTAYGKAYGHTGFMPGFNSIFVYYPELNIAIALQSNCDYARANMPFHAYSDEILKIIVEN